ncbi:hypothetical protein BGZ73_007227 [Actinomortierella ambigua]|nr:hypothetical protein BGZ73_007227 [Actinomortierella ambigua]
MQSGSSDYLTVGDLSHHPPRPNPLQPLLKKIDSSVINRAYPGLYQQGTRHDLSQGDNAFVFEQSLVTFRELIVQQLWKVAGEGPSSTMPTTSAKPRYENVADFCRRQWNIDTRRANALVEYAGLLLELAAFPVRPKTEVVCNALLRASDTLQPSPLQRQSLAPALWAKLLEAWQTAQQQQALDAGGTTGISASSSGHVPPGTTTTTAASTTTTSGTLLGVEYISEEFIHEVLIKPHLVLKYQQQLEHKQKEQEFLKQQLQQQHQQQQQQQQQQQEQQRLLAQSTPLVALAPPTIQTSSISTAATATPTRSLTPVPAPLTPASGHQSQSSTTATMPSSSSKVRCEDIAELVESDGRRFHAPRPIVERVHQFFGGAPQLDPAHYEGSWWTDAAAAGTVKIPFPEILDAEGPWSVVDPATGASQAIASCFLHVPMMPTKRRFENEEEVVVLEDTRMARVMNERLWDEFAQGNVKEAITLVPFASTWFQTNELADWPCVILRPFKFEQANGQDPSGKKYYEFHNYMVIYLGHDHLRQVQFVETFQDLGISPMVVRSGDPANNTANGHRWIAGYRRIMRPQSIHGVPNGVTPSLSSSTAPGAAFSSSSSSSLSSHSATDTTSLVPATAAAAASSTIGGGSWTTLQGSHTNGGQHYSNLNGSLHGNDDTSWIDPRADDIYSALPPFKKPRLERIGRPSDAKAAWHHSKRRKTDAEAFFKLMDQNLPETPFGKDDGNMSE